MKSSFRRQNEVLLMLVGVAEECPPRDRTCASITWCGKGTLQIGLSWEFWGGQIELFCCVYACSVTQSCPTLSKLMDCSTQSFLSFTISWSLLKLMSIELVIPSNYLHPLLSPSPPALNLSQHRGLFQWVSSSHQVAKVLELQLQFFQWIFRVDFPQLI